MCLTSGTACLVISADLYRSNARATVSVSSCRLGSIERLSVAHVLPLFVIGQLKSVDDEPLEFLNNEPSTEHSLD